MQKCLPLRGLKILDFSRLLPGPFCTYLLKELGANIQVIYSPFDQEVLTFPALRAGKKWAALDLKNKKGYHKACQLLSQSDVLLEGFRPGVMEKLGLGFKRAKKINPKIIYCSLTGYGQKGKKKAGHDLNYLAVSGMLSALFPGGAKPLIPGVPLGDLIAGLSAAFQIVSTLHIPKSRRKAIYLDLAITEAVSTFLSPLDKSIQKAIQAVFSGARARYRLYECSDQRYLAVAPLEEKFWKKFAEAMQIPFAILQAGENKTIQWLKEKFIAQTQDYWAKRLSDPDLCVTAVK